jgi:exodeoxyribonuclease V alpha subunit
VTGTQPAKLGLACKAQTLIRELLYTALTRFRKRLIVLMERNTAVLDDLPSSAFSDMAKCSAFVFDLLLGNTAQDIELTLSRSRPQSPCRSGTILRNPGFDV